LARLKPCPFKARAIADSPEIPSLRNRMLHGILPRIFKIQAGAHARTASSLSAFSCKNSSVPHHHLHGDGDARVSLSALRRHDQQPVFGDAADDEHLGNARRAVAVVSWRVVCGGLLSIANLALWSEAWLAADGVDPGRSRDSGNVCGTGWIAGRVYLHDNAVFNSGARIP
jgi:hypothetical protein